MCVPKTRIVEAMFKTRCLRRNGRIDQYVLGMLCHRYRQKINLCLLVCALAPLASVYCTYGKEGYTTCMLEFPFLEGLFYGMLIAWYEVSFEPHLPSCVYLSNVARRIAKAAYLIQTFHHPHAWFLDMRFPELFYAGGFHGHAALTAYLPPGGWHRFNSSSRSVLGPQNVTIAAPKLDEIVMFVRGGSVLTLDANHADKQTTADLGGVLEVHLYAAWSDTKCSGSSGSGSGGGGNCTPPNVLVEDDGVSLKAPARRTSFVFDGSNQLQWSVAVEPGFVPMSMHYSTMTVTLFLAKGGVVRHLSSIAIGSGGNITL